MSRIDDTLDSVVPRIYPLWICDLVIGTFQWLVKTNGRRSLLDPMIVSSTTRYHSASQACLLHFKEYRVICGLQWQVGLCY